MPRILDSKHAAGFAVKSESYEILADLNVKIIRSKTGTHKIELMNL